MYNAFLTRTKETILALSKHIRTSEKLRTALFDGALNCAGETPCFDSELVSRETAPDRLEWRIIDHCTVVTRIYAIYEQFTHEMIREHLSLLQARISFPNLPQSIQSSYRLGIAKILDKMEGSRFADLDLGQLIKEYYLALNGQDYALEPRALLMQEQNLRLPELHRLMNACGIDNVTHWIEQHRAVLSFFDRQDRLAASAKTEMAELIKYRNDAAHGSIDISNILHVNVLIEFCDFVDALCEAIAERVQLAGLQSLRLHNIVSERGKVSESLKEGTVAIGEMTGAFKVGAKVYLCGEAYCLERTILSLQIESIHYEEVSFTTATKLGIRFDAPGKKNAVIMAFEPDIAANCEQIEAPGE